MTQDKLKQILKYDPDTGIFTWLETNNKDLIGKEAGYINDAGYRVITIKGKQQRAHRLAWFYMTGVKPRRIVDHKDNDRLNNKWENLRLANTKQNRCNTVLASNNTSGYKGVYWSNPRQKWVATINFNYKRRHLGYYDCPKAAHIAYVKAAKKLHGAFANFGG